MDRSLEEVNNIIQNGNLPTIGRITSGVCLGIDTYQHERDSKESHGVDVHDSTKRGILEKDEA